MTYRGGGGGGVSNYSPTWIPSRDKSDEMSKSADHDNHLRAPLNPPVHGKIEDKLIRVLRNLPIIHLGCRSEG